MKSNIVVIGDLATGKTSLVKRYVNGCFEGPDMATTVGVDMYTKDIVLDSTNVRLMIWDTSGQERYRTITSGYFRCADAILFFYDRSKQETLDNVKYWVRHAERFSQPNVLKFLIEAKYDLPKTCDGEEELAEREDMRLISCSAKSGVGVNEAFHEIARSTFEEKNKMKNLPSDEIYLHVFPRPVSPKAAECCRC